MFFKTLIRYSTLQFFKLQHRMQRRDLEPRATVVVPRRFSGDY